jgi:hypothetical protein
VRGSAGRLPRFGPVAPSSAEDLDLFEDDRESMTWYTIAEVAGLCRRSPGTITDLVSRYQLRRKTAWVTRKRLRKRVTLLSPGVARWLQQVTLFRRRELLDSPPTGGTR